MCKLVIGHIGMHIPVLVKEVYSYHDRNTHMAQMQTQRQMQVQMQMQMQGTDADADGMM